MYPILFKFGSIGIHTYGVVLVIAFFFSLWLVKKDAKRLNIDEKTIDELATYLLIGGLAGARIYYACFYDPIYYLKYPWTLLFIWEGGLAIHGALIGGVLSAVLFCKKRKLNFWQIADLVSPFLILGQAIGRIGCFLNGCCYGLPTNKPWGVIFPKGSFAYYKYGMVAVHPTEIYEMVLDFIGFFILFFLRKRIKIKGFLFCFYLIYYSVIRFFVSFFRGDSLYLWGTNIRIAQLTSIVVIIISLEIIFYLKGKVQNHG
jgi:phosphatidylglycerol:prolipoprotein diacylglycerol transferase